MNGDTEDTPQAGEDSVDSFGISAGSKLRGNDGPCDVCQRDVSGEILLGVLRCYCSLTTDLPDGTPAEDPRYRRPPSPGGP